MDSESLTARRCKPCEGGVTALAGDELDDLAGRLDGWSVVDGRQLEKDYRFKDFDLRGRIPFFAAVLIAIGIAVVSTDPPLVLLGLFMSYAVSGPVLTLHRRRRLRQGRRAG